MQLKNSLRTSICGIDFKTPIIAASGTFGYGVEFVKHTDLGKIGGIAVKGISLDETIGNPMPRLCETASGVLNAIGLQNIGIEHFLSEKLPVLRNYDTKVIVNFWGKTFEDYIATAKRLDNEDVDMLEMNISCPNIKEGGISFSSSPEKATEILKAVREVVKNKPLIVKLSPNVTDIKEYLKAVEGAGADAVSLINTLMGMAVDIEKMRPKLANITGGLSGPAIKPVALRMVYDAYKTVKIAIIGIGGIMNGIDAAEFIAVGADMVQIGMANFTDPDSCVKAAYELQDFLERKNIASVSELKGRAVKDIAKQTANLR